MDKACLKIHCLTDSHEQECHKDGYVEAPGVEVPKASIRRSSRLQSKRKVSSCSQDAHRSYYSSSKKSSKACVDRKNSISEEDKKHQLPHRNENNSLFSADTASMKSSMAVPSFEYHVRAKDGIRLVVDLNLKRSDWLTSMEKAVCVCQNHQKLGFESFRKEVECLGDKNNLKVSSPDKTTASDASMNSYVQNKFSIKSMSRDIGRTLPSVVELEKEVTTVSSLEFYSPNAECLENVAFSSEENQFSDFSSHQKGSSCSRTTSTFEVNQETAGNHRRSTVENRESINYAERMEVPGSSDDGPKRRKHNEKSDYIHGQSHERNLRSTKLLGGQILEQGGLVIRRSSRLLSKGGGRNLLN